ncbi:hypothetical protein J7T55_004213 [Diaporthe amygdali]|uniref:uncharacterized protein n=1 Tax=Phomopsis amygdali TaxID=1214568 RepID=UPI0022FEF0EE|nr:uncharacterized protein J7T55_004213 [Diaporthe amygdali]KAJ0103810.1 hypothetical protein J7T55_004213 [Diaporthe amygdali]
MFPLSQSPVPYILPNVSNSFILDLNFRLAAHNKSPMIRDSGSQTPKVYTADDRSHMYTADDRSHAYSIPAFIIVEYTT